MTPIILASLFLLFVNSTASAFTEILLSQLNATLNGRIKVSVPHAAPCFPDPHGAQCLGLKEKLLSSSIQSNRYQGFQYMQGEACLADPSDQCLSQASTLNTPGNASCAQGLVSPLYVEISGPSDVQNIFEYARKSGTILFIKNSGHGYVMRSSRRGSLAIWTRGLRERRYHASFVPEGCTNGPKTTAITFGPGVNTDGAITFAHKNGLVFDGGSSGTIGVSGGWLLNGGHSVLSNNIGLGVDRILQFTVATPNGHRTASQCENPELFWALRGGGGGAFGVVLNSTFRVEREAPITTAVIGFDAPPDEQRRFVQILADNMQSWALKGWGGPVGTNLAILVNPRREVNSSAAMQTLAPLIAHALAQKGKAKVTTYRSYFDFYRDVVNGTHATPVPVSVSVITTSRIIPESVFTNSTTRSKMADTIMGLQESGLTVSMLSTMPLLYGRSQAQHKTSIHPAWYRSVWSIIAYGMLTAETPLQTRASVVSLLQRGAQSLKELAPDGCTYSNEGYAWLKDWSQEFWGDNYPALLELKRRYDPDQLLSCWHCVGWDESEPDYECISGLTPSGS